jgi:hypothetical protein
MVVRAPKRYRSPALGNRRGSVRHGPEVFLQEVFLSCPQKLKSALDPKVTERPNSPPPELLKRDFISPSRACKYNFPAMMVAPLCYSKERWNIEQDAVRKILHIAGESQRRVCL